MQLPKKQQRDLDYVCIQDMDTLKSVLRRAWKRGVLSYDCETTGLNVHKDTIVGISLAVDPYQGYYVPLTHQTTEPQLDLVEVLEVMKPVLESPVLMKVLHNAKFDGQMLLRYGIKLNGFDDTMAMSYSMFGGKHRHNMDDLASIYLNHKTTKFSEVAGNGTFDMVPLDAATWYAAEDADVTLRLYEHFQSLLEKDDAGRDVYATVDLPLVTTLVQMEQRGIKVDEARLAELDEEFKTRRDEVLDDLEGILGHEFNPASPRQVAAVLQAAGASITEVTASGQTATGADVLEDLLEKTQNTRVKSLVKGILEWRKFSKLVGTYTEGLAKAINPDTGRIHASFSQTSTATGRLACSDPNLQNIPIRTKEGREIRTAFVAEEGNVLIAADYSQIELRILAHVCGDPAMLKAFEDGIDIHKATAAKVLGKPVSDVTSDERRAAKTVNFGIIYGQTKYGLAAELKISPDAAQEIIEEYFRTFPGIKDYTKTAVEFGHAHGHVHTLIGRKVWLPDINASIKWRRQHAERAALNAPIQGSAADVIREAMLKVEDMLAAEKLQTELLLQVHDELVFEAPADEAEEARDLIVKTMETAGSYLSVPLLVDAKIGNNWSEAH